ncbi:hypothetical protein B0J12DRAFT_662120 [Macrophomina phaseolina]|uniref:Uncharacterized protein n=1 Tax=Macrophomina phaseolina TaxID=35725 RepID=A0ABQ8GCC1_9PEZI|nr:hypothetical protein B0J12DRAFT_662120 [Macrophomina phaseolina]
MLQATRTAFFARTRSCVALQQICACYRRQALLTSLYINARPANQPSRGLVRLLAHSATAQPRADACHLVPLRPSRCCRTIRPGASPAPRGLIVHPHSSHRLFVGVGHAIKNFPSCIHEQFRCPGIPRSVAMADGEPSKRHSGMFSEEAAELAPVKQLKHPALPALSLSTGLRAVAISKCFLVLHSQPLLQPIAWAVPAPARGDVPAAARN